VQGARRRDMKTRQRKEMILDDEEVVVSRGEERAVILDE
jgi:hypothetical protein